MLLNREDFDKLFITRLIVYLVALQALAWWLSGFKLIQQVLANLAALVCQTFGLSVIVAENKLINPDTFHFVIVDHQCTAMSLLATITAIICSLNRAILNKAACVFYCCIAIQTMNVLRIAHLFYLVDFQKNLFDLFHLYLWQAFNFLYAIAVFVFLYRKLQGKDIDGYS